MRDMPIQLAGAQTTLREVRTSADRATQRAVASAITLSETVGRLTRGDLSS
ncbi:MAG: hypothetical protein HIU86_10280 [Acidobacteria bacterium]|nr:hypothetical protein [Acidobacteriota bacterium]